MTIEGVRPLEPGEVATLLGATVPLLRVEVAALPPPCHAWHPAAGEWCIKEVVGHLIEAERRGFAGRIRVILGGSEPRLEAWDQLAVARARRDCEREVGELLDELARLRESSVALVAGRGPDDLERGGHHPQVGHLCIGDLLHEWVHHDRNHVKQVLAIVQAFAWPAMGNAQRFSAE
jgi:hypothetical protein